MAVQFPNFLSVPVRTPDWSGISDIVQNYYAGKAMPKDDMIKAIQAEFARPNAEQSLLGSRLTNKKNQLEINRMSQELAERTAFEKQFRQALQANQVPISTSMGNPVQNNMPLPPIRNQAPIGASAAQASQVAGIPGVNILGADSGVDDGIDRTRMDARYRKFDQMATGLPKSAYTGNQGAPATPIAPPNTSIAPAAPMTPEPVAPEPEIHEIVLSKGQPHLAGVDQMYDSNPLSRAFLEKKGYKKSEEVKFDNKTGRTTIITKYPSGKITTQTYGGNTGGEGAPLTNAMITQHQKVISGVDNVIPVLEKILKLGGGEKVNEKGKVAGKNKDVFQPYPKSSGWTGGMGLIPGWMSDSANYESLVTSAAEPLVNALGYPKTNEGIEKAVKQVTTTHGELNSRYIKRIRALIEDLKERKNYSAKEIKRSNKISPVDTGAGGQTYSSDDYEVANG